MEAITFISSITKCTALFRQFMSTYPKASQVILTKEYMANLIAVAPTCKNYWGWGGGIGGSYPGKGELGC